MLAIIPIFIGIIGFLALLQSPYTGLHFKSQNNKWYISSIDQDSPAAGLYKELIGVEVIEISGWKLNKCDLASELNTDIIVQKDLYHFIDAQKYFNEHINRNVPFSIIFVSNQNHSLQSVQITPVEYPFSQFLKRSGLMFLFAYITVFIGILIFIKRPEENISQVFAFMALCASLIEITYITTMAKDILLPFLYISQSIL